MATITNRAISNPPPAPNPCCCPACTGLQCLDRTRFFAGQLLTEADLNNDQSYWLAKSRLHNRYLHGWGVVCGMQVVCGDCDGWVTVKAGYAIDPCGNDLILCADQPFNVLKAIQACCTPPKPADCSPMRAAPPPNCKDAKQKWCITIQYEEQSTRPVTPLRQSSTQTASCGCGGTSKGGCGCGGKHAAGTACCCSTSPTRASTTPGCEPTRILEGFKLGVCPAPPEETTANLGVSTNAGISTGTSAFASSACFQTIRKLILQQPSLANVADPNAAFTIVCNYLASIRRFLSSSSFTTCKAKDDLDNLTVPKPTDVVQGYIAQLQALVASMVQLLTALLLDCLCLSLLPTCPPDPCTNCLVLACVTVQNGQIIDICHFGGGRRQVVTFPSLGYWLSLFGLDKTLTTITNFLEQLCCGGEFSRLFQSVLAPSENIGTAGFTNPAMLQRALSSTLTQNLGATIINAAVPGVRTIDLGPLVGLGVEQVASVIKSNNIQAHMVEASAAWTDSVAAQGSQFAPSAFPAGQSLTVFTRNKLVVGFEPTSPTDSMKFQLDDLKAQVTALQKRIGSLPAPPTVKRPRRG